MLSLADHTNARSTWRINDETADPLVEGDSGGAKGLAKPAIQNQVFGRAGCDASVAQQPELIAASQRQVEVMGRDQDSARGRPSQLFEQLHDFDAARQIEVGGRLVKQHDVGVLRQGARDHQLLPLPVAEFGEWHIRQVAGADGLYCPVDGLMVSRRQSSQPIAVRMPSHRHQSVAIHQARLRRQGQYDAQAASQSQW